jgi:uncharacterized protein (DUF58 family)
MLAMLAAMWYAAEAQSNGAAYLLALLAGLLAVISVMHARANLRGLRLRVRAVQAAREGVPGRVRAEIVQEGAAPAFGVEVQVVGANQSVYIDQITPGQPRIIELPAPTHAGGATTVLLARSAYPLGLFSMERAVESAAARRVHARPAGNLPLPATEPLSARDADAHTGARGTARGARGGDDFAGTREFQPGDSPRHIDWRAVARGRPLVVKTWDSSATGVVRIDWESIPLLEGARAGQIARWIELCVQEEKLFALHLPQKDPIGPGGGETHARRCLDALADFTAQTQAGSAGTGAQREGRASAPSTFENSSHLPAGPFFMLSAGLLAAMLPLMDHVALPCLGVALLCLIYRAFFRRGVPPLLVRLAVLFGGVALTISLYAGQRSMEAGIALLVALMGVKLLESRTPREFQVLALIGWFLCLCMVILDNSLPRTLWCLAVFLLICACMARFRLSAAGFWRPARFTGILFLQALPLMVVLFLFLPRGLLNLTALLNSRLGQSGISTELDPGTITAMAMRLERAFRIEFPDGAVPANEMRYWRCITLTDCRGFSWRRARDIGLKFNPDQPEDSDVRQRILLDPHGAQWLPALDVPLRCVDANGARMDPLNDDTVIAPYRIGGMHRYTAFSRPKQLDARPLEGRERRDALQLPAELPQRVRQLALDWRRDAQTDLQIVQRGVQYLQTEGFKYTLTPDEYVGAAALERFLFEGKNGFCEHFAAAFATLMRIAGVPSRVVIGYLGGEYSDKTGQMIVRQSDAHAWVEVWLEERGWTRLDPTAALAPGRVNDFRTYLNSGAGSGVLADMGLWRRAVFETRLVWDRLNFAWQESVVEYNQESQEGWLSRLGIAWRPWHLLLLSALVLLSALYAIYRWLRRKRRVRDPWLRAWQLLGEKLHRAGFAARHAGEGPLDYARRISTPQMDIRALAETYAQGRYGADGADASVFLAEVRRLRVKARRGKAA